MFIDLVKIEVKSGNGGNGAIAWRREKYVPRGGPAGGDGGRGGNVILQADQNMSTLLEFKYKSIFEAEHGEHGKSKNCHGRSGKDLIIKVPAGTLVRDTNTNDIVADLCYHGQKVLIAAGGNGGRGNSNFATSTRQAPQFCEPGEPGVNRILELELKLLADIGIIGLPNAGKSTLISVISAAKPKIANYPFTTLVPNLGVVKTPEGDGLVFADIPGLIEGSSDGSGLGHQFLRHVERTRMLIHMVDALEPDPIQNYQIIRKELKKYSKYLDSLEEIIAINKIDSTDSETIEIIEDSLQEENKPIFKISAATTDGINELINYVFERIKHIPKEIQTFEIIEDPAAYYNDDSYFEIIEKKGAYIVKGGKISRLIGVTDLTSSEAIYRLQKILKSMGVFQALKDAGVEDGDLVMIDSFEFEYIDEDLDALEYETLEEELVEELDEFEEINN
ncbi:MAG: GTPase ObgE [Cyanobacteriota bacterium]